MDGTVYKSVGRKRVVGDILEVVVEGVSVDTALLHYVLDSDLWHRLFNQ